MKVKDLIAKLKNYHDEMEVVLNGDDHSYVEHLLIYENWAERNGTHIGEAQMGDDGAFSVLVIE